MSLTRYAVTGTSVFPTPKPTGDRLNDMRARMRAYQDCVSVINRSLMGLTDVGEITTGAAPTGADVEAFYLALAIHPRVRHRVIVPVDCPHAELLVRIAKNKGCEIIEVPGKPPKGYMDRNDLLVEHCDVLLSYPKTPDEELRSGTWATVRRARKAAREIRVFPVTGYVVPGHLPLQPMSVENG